jgi:hypothetical protein
MIQGWNRTGHVRSFSWKARTEFDATLRPNRVTAQASGHGILPAIDAAQYGEKLDAATHDDVEIAGFSGIRSVLVIPGWCASTRPQLRNCAPGNPWIPGSMLRIAPE